MLKNTIINSFVLGALFSAPTFTSEPLAKMTKTATVKITTNKSADYYHDEAQNPKGPHSCTPDLECDGLRTCHANGICHGKARKTTKAVDYMHNEANNPKGAKQCDSDADCDGLRVCSPLKWCQGTARLTPLPMPQDIKDALAVLGLDENATIEQVKKQYRDNKESLAQAHINQPGFKDTVLKNGVILAEACKKISTFFSTQNYNMQRGKLS